MSDTRIKQLEAGYDELRTVNNRLQRDNARLQARVEELEKGLRQFEAVNLSEANCASYSVANDRIRNLARKLLEDK